MAERRQVGGQLKEITLITLTTLKEITLNEITLISSPQKSRMIINRLTLITTGFHIMARYEGDWVAGLREGKGKYLSKATGENAASDDQNDGG